MVLTNFRTIMRGGLGVTCLMLVVRFSVLAQDDIEINIAADFDLLDIEWHEIARGLDNYGGFKNYCTSRDYQSKVLNNLNSIHHYDSLIILKINDPAYTMSAHERKATLKEISKFESKYSARNFIKTLKRECKERKEIEKEHKHDSGGFGQDTYDGQKYILEVELGSYVHHITKMVDHIDKHLHHINLH